MKQSEIMKNLIEYNEWRRGGEGEQPCPTSLGLTIDRVLKMLTAQNEAIDSQLQTIDAMKKRLQALHDARTKWGGDNETAINFIIDILCILDGKTTA